MKRYHFDDVSLLVTHYNRSTSLERLLETFFALNCVFHEIVVSDDGSCKLHVQKLTELQQHYNFILIKSDQNKGLGNNINKGQDATTAPFTLYVQEDFIPTKLFPDSFCNAVQILREQNDFDIVRFYAYYNYPYLKEYEFGYSEMLYKFWYLKYRKIYMYSDHPHLRRSDFLLKFGRYDETITGDRMEYRKCIQFIQRKGKGMFFTNYTELFIQQNSDAEPSTMTRKTWTNTKNPAITVIRNVYRQLKYNLDIFFLKV
jgi:glycosyltransferase involved in cell wall biosynthesis